MAHISPWRPHLQNNKVIKEALRPAFNITKFITDFQFEDGYKPLVSFFLFLFLIVSFMAQCFNLQCRYKPKLDKGSLDLSGQLKQ